MSIKFYCMFVHPHVMNPRTLFPWPSQQQQCSVPACLDHCLALSTVCSHVCNNKRGWAGVCLCLHWSVSPTAIVWTAVVLVWHPLSGEAKLSGAGKFFSLVSFCLRYSLETAFCAFRWWISWKHIFPLIVTFPVWGWLSSSWLYLPQSAGLDISPGFIGCYDCILFLWSLQMPLLAQAFRPSVVRHLDYPAPLPWH